MQRVQLQLEAMAHPGRRRMVELVMDCELAVGELAELTGMTQPATSQHLRVLRAAGLVDVRVDGQRRLYRVNFAGLAALRSELDRFWGDHLESLREVTEGGR